MKDLIKSLLRMCTEEEQVLLSALAETVTYPYEGGVWERAFRFSCAKDDVRKIPVEYGKGDGAREWVISLLGATGDEWLLAILEPKAREWLDKVSAI